MDLSKLPKFSQTPPAPAAPGVKRPLTEDETSAANQPVRGTLQPQPTQARSPQLAGGAAQVWICAIMGIVLLMLSWNFARFLGCKLTGKEFHTNVTWQTDDRAGQEVAYFELMGHTAWSEMGLFLFGLALILEALVIATTARNTPASRAGVAVSMLFTAATTLLNIYVCILLLNDGTMPLLTALAVAYGGFMAISEFQLLRELRALANLTPVQD